MVFGPSPLLPVVNDPDGKQHDPLFTPRVESAVSKAQELNFPPDFIFGSATSAYQVEGGIVDTNWNRWENRKTRKDGGDTIKNGESAGAACDMWNLFETVDLPLIIQLGLGSFRFSIEWSRVEPTEGNFDNIALARYVSWCRKLREAGVEPCVTLLHFTEPGWFIDRGGWEKRANVACFVRFAKHVIERLAPHCSQWCTLNEPVGCSVNGWLAGIHPPGRQGAVVTTCCVLFHMLLGHRDASKAISAATPAAGKPMWIMIANNIVWFEATWRWNVLTRALAAFLNMFFNFCCMDLCVHGRLICVFDLFFCLFGIRRDMRSLRGTINTIGVNNYARVQLAMGLFTCCCPSKPAVRGDGEVCSGEQNIAAGCISGDPHNPRFEMSDMEWDLVPSSLGKALRTFWKRYRLPLLVTESGIADGNLNDERRVRYLSGCLRAVAGAIDDGVDVRGYTYWSLLDNFEWAEGFRPRFGLYRIDYTDMSRHETGGLRLYRDVIHRHRSKHERSTASTASTPSPDSVAIQIDGVAADDGTKQGGATASTSDPVLANGVTSDDGTAVTNNDVDC